MSHHRDSTGRMYKPRSGVPVTPEGYQDGAGDLDVTGLLKGKRFVVVGGTGFLGKVLVALFLKRFPEIGHMYLMVRAKPGLTPEDRFDTEQWPSPCFDVIRDEHGDDAREWVRGKLTAIAGDVTHPRAGISDELLEEFKKEGIDAVLNVAGVVSFTPPIDEGFNVNALGVENLIQLCLDINETDDPKKGVPLMHTSTCYVAGERIGRVFEDAPNVHPFPKCAEMDVSHWDPAREMEEGLALAKAVRARANDAQLTSRFQEEAREKLRKKGAPTSGPVFDQLVEKLRNKHIDKVLVDEGTERAVHWGWPNTYTYTKSVGEQLLHNSGLPYTIVRPAIVESSLEFPFPGWNEGINTSAPLIYLALHGHTQYPTADGHVLDVIPVDLVCYGTVLAAAALLEGTQKSVYQFGSSDTNPLTMNRLIELTGLYKRKFMRSRNRGNPLLNRMYARIEPIPVAPKVYKRRSVPALMGAIDVAAKGLGALKGTPVGGVAKSTQKTLKSVRWQLSGVDMVMTAFLPFVSELDYRFRNDHTRALYRRATAVDKEKLNYRPESYDWRDYWQNVHIKGLRKWVFPHLDARLLKRPRAEERFSDLVALLEEVGEREGANVALQSIEHMGEPDATLSMTSYRELLERARACAARLADVGVHPGARVGLVAKNSREWAIGFFGILFAGATVVPLESTLSSSNLGARLKRVGVEFALLDMSVEAVDEAACLDLEEFTELPPRGVTISPPEVLVSPDDEAMIPFTAGASGDAKPVVLTHKNLTAVLASVAPLFKISRRDTSLSVLPLHNSFELTCGLLLPLLRGAKITYVEDVTSETLSEAFKVAGITAMVGVPQVWHDLEEKLVNDLKKQGPFAEAAYEVGQALNDALGKSLGVNLGRVFFRPMNQSLGGKVRFLMSSGGHLSKKTRKTFQNLGIDIKEGYGLTEAAPVLSVGGAKGTTPLPGVEVELQNVDDDGVGEIVTRGDNVMSGYLDDDQATDAALGKDGWLRTGDLGRIDKKGRLTIVARDNEVITKSDGKRVYPRGIEEALQHIDGVVEVCVVGVPDGTGGERAIALVVDDKSADRASIKDLVSKEMRKLPRSERADDVLYTKKPLPRTADHKVIRPDVIAEVVALEVRQKAPEAEVAAMPEVIEEIVRKPRERLKAPTAKERRKKKKDAPLVEVPRSLQSMVKGALHKGQMAFYDRGMKVNVEGESHIPYNRQTIVVANHASHLDMGLVKYALGSYGSDLVTLAAKDYFFEGKWRRAYFENFTNLRPLDRSDNPREAMREADALLNEGKTVLVFPEGTRTTSGELGQFRAAVTYLAMRHDVDILPLYLDGTYRSMPRGGVVPRNRHLTVKIGAPLAIDALKDKAEQAGLRTSQSSAKGAEVVRQALEALRDGKSFDFDDALAVHLGLEDAKEEEGVDEEHPLQGIFSYLQDRFQKDVVNDAITYYFSLGQGPETKWTVKVDKESCSIVNEKTGPADCIMKTDVAMFTRIVRENYMPEPADFFSGTIKTNDPELLVSFVQVFGL